MKIITGISFIGIILSFLTISCASKAPSAQAKTKEDIKNPAPKNIILMIADGTGLSQISSSLFYSEQPSNYERFRHIGLIKTSSASDLITDSAAGATAFSAGIKTYNGAIGVDTDTIATPTILEELSDRGYATGVIATSTITHATPASFYAHVKYRRMEEEIADALAKSSVDFFAGGGLKFFNQRSDQKDLLALLGINGFEIHTNSLNSNTTINQNKKQAFLLADGGMPKMIEGRGPFLEDATRLGISHLSKDTDGFFLMVESGRIDHGHHAGNAYNALEDTIEFANAVQAAVDSTDPDETLIIVTADHSHVFTIAGYPKRGNPILGKVVNVGSEEPALASDGMPYTTVGYTNGRGFKAVGSETDADAGYAHDIVSERQDLTNVDTTTPGFHQEALVPKTSETHAGEDVGVHAIGPGSHLITGTNEQSLIYHVINHAADLVKKAEAKM